MLENENIFVDNINEINLKDVAKLMEVNMSCNQTIQLEKVFGSLIFCGVRITPVFETGNWKIERECINQDEQDNDVVTWETVCEFNGQESIHFDEE
ncbi:TPA: hypothetical protein ACXDAZ_002636 [Clostridium botulinum]